MTSTAQFFLTFFGQSVLIFSGALLAAKLVSRVDSRLGILRYAFVGLILITAIRVASPVFSNPWMAVQPKQPELQTLRFSDLTPLPSSLSKPESITKSASYATATQATPQTHIQETAKFPSIDPASLVLAIWIAGTLILLSRVLAGTVWMNRLHRTAKSLQFSPAGEVLLQLAREFGVNDVKIAESAMVSSPLVSGFKNPTIYLPSSSPLGDEELEAVLSHELAHVRGKDPLWALLTQLISAIVWPNPLVWVARNQMSFAAEERCDLSVLQNGAKAAIYAECLVQIAERTAVRPSNGSLSVGMFSSKKHLKKRIHLLFDGARLKQSPLALTGHAKLACGAGVIALASCIAVPKSPSDVRIKANTKEESFPASSKEISAVKGNELPYIAGDFTLVYRIVSQDPRSDAQRQSEFEADHAGFANELKKYVTNGKITQAEADADLKRFVLNPRPPRSEKKVTLSSRNGVLLYKVPGGIVNLLTSDFAYLTFPDQADQSKHLNILNWLDLPLPATGFVHFPLSLAKIDTKSLNPDVPDFPYLNGINGNHDVLGNGIVSDLVRIPAKFEFEGTGRNRRLKHILRTGRLEYDFKEFIPFKGNQIASKFTRMWGGTHRDYTLEFSSSKSLPAYEFEPGYVARGKRMRMTYKGRELEFTADPNGSNLQAQFEKQIPVADAEELRRKKDEAHDAYLATLPVGGPDIMPLYNKALADAKDEGKVVIAISTATTCPPCHMLERMLKDPTVKPIADKHYKLLWIDCGEMERGKPFENKNGEVLCKQLGIWTGFPSYAAIEPETKKITVVGTVGYPDNKSDYDKFFKVFNPNGKLLSAEEVKTIQSYLDSHR